MARWADGARERLAEAALQLFVERGFTDTSAADIAERAGLTRSSFFRLVGDKREVLFSQQDIIVDTLCELRELHVAATPPPERVDRVFDVFADFFDEAGRAVARERSVIIAAQPELLERDLLKRAHVHTAILDVIGEGETGSVRSRMTATLMLLAMDLAFEQWIAAPSPPPFRQLLDSAWNDLRAAHSES